MAHRIGNSTRTRDGMLELRDKIGLALRNPMRALNKLSGRFSLVNRRARQYDRETVAVMRRVLHLRANCVDVGAFRGDILHEILVVSPLGCHHAFEPLPTRAAALRREFPKVNVLEAALSDRPGRTTFAHVTARPTVSGLRPRPDLPAAEAIETIEVEAIRLDDALTPTLPTHFIKIDVEGAELLVLRGARETLRRWKPYVVFEHSDRIARPYGYGSPDVFDFLAGEVGLRLNLMSRWLGGEPSLDRAFLRCGQVEGHYYFLAYA